MERNMVEKKGKGGVSKIALSYSYSISLSYDNGEDFKQGGADY